MQQPERNLTAAEAVQAIQHKMLNGQPSGLWLTRYIDSNAVAIQSLIENDTFGLFSDFDEENNPAPSPIDQVNILQSFLKGEARLAEYNIVEITQRLKLFTDDFEQQDTKLAHSLEVAQREKEVSDDTRLPNQVVRKLNALNKIQILNQMERMLNVMETNTQASEQDKIALQVWLMAERTQMAHNLPPVVLNTKVNNKSVIDQMLSLFVLSVAGLMCVIVYMITQSIICLGYIYMLDLLKRQAPVLFSTVPLVGLIMISGFILNTIMQAKIYKWVANVVSELREAFFFTAGLDRITRPSRRAEIYRSLRESLAAHWDELEMLAHRDRLEGIEEIEEEAIPIPLNVAAEPVLLPLQQVQAAPPPEIVPVVNNAESSERQLNPNQRHKLMQLLMIENVALASREIPEDKKIKKTAKISKEQTQLYYDRTVLYTLTKMDKKILAKQPALPAEFQDFADEIDRFRSNRQTI